MTGELNPHDGPYVINRHDTLYRGRKRLMAGRVARIKHPVISSLLAATSIALGTSSAFVAPILDPYFTDAVRIYLLVAVLSLGTGMLYKHEAVYRRTLLLPYIRHYVGMWLTLSFAFFLFGLCFGNWVIRL